MITYMVVTTEISVLGGVPWFLHLRYEQKNGPKAALSIRSLIVDHEVGYNDSSYYYMKP